MNFPINFTASTNTIAHALMMPVFSMIFSLNSMNFCSFSSSDSRMSLNAGIKAVATASRISLKRAVSLLATLAADPCVRSKSPIALPALSVISVRVAAAFSCWVSVVATSFPV